MKKYLFLIIFLKITSFSFSQTYTFEKRAEGNYYKLDIFKNPFDNYKYLYKSNLYSVAQNNIDMVKTDSSGNILNNFAISHSSFYGINSIMPVESGFLVGASDLSPDPASKSRMIKFNDNGAIQWSKDYNIPFSYFFHPVFSENTKNEIISIASINQNSPDPSVFLIHKTDTNGNVLNTFSYEINNLPGAASIATYDLIKLSNGNYASINSIRLGYCKEPVILFLDTSFNVISAYKMETSIGAIPENFKLIKKTDDGFFIAGNFYNAGGLTFSFVANSDSSLNHIWAIYTSNNTSAVGIQFKDLKELSDGNILVMGDYYNSGWERDILIANFDSAGNLNWGKVVGTGDDEIYSSSVYEDNDGIYIAGMADSGQVGFSSDCLFIKTDLMGNTSCWGASIPMTINNFNVTFSPVTFSQTSVAIGDSNIATSPLPGFTFIPICDGIVSVNENNFSANEITIYPNPAVNELIIDNMTEPAEISVYNILGSVLIRLNNSMQNGLTNIDVSGLENGIYFLKIVTLKGEVVRKFVVNK